MIHMIKWSSSLWSQLSSIWSTRWSSRSSWSWHLNVCKGPLLSPPTRTTTEPVSSASRDIWSEYLFGSDQILIHVLFGSDSDQDHIDLQLHNTDVELFWSRSKSDHWQYFIVMICYRHHRALYSHSKKIKFCTFLIEENIWACKIICTIFITWQRQQYI